jgi:hypothetical protein
VLSGGDISDPISAFIVKASIMKLWCFPTQIVIRRLTQFSLSKSGPLLPWIPYIRSRSGDDADSSVKFEVKAVKV